MALIDFTEKPFGTTAPQITAGPTTVQFNGIITDDGARPADSPVLAGSRDFRSAVTAEFTTPVREV